MRRTCWWISRMRRFAWAVQAWGDGSIGTEAARTERQGLGTESRLILRRAGGGPRLGAARSRRWRTPHGRISCCSVHQTATAWRIGRPRANTGSRQAPSRRPPYWAHFAHLKIPQISCLFLPLRCCPLAPRGLPSMRDICPSVPVREMAAAASTITTRIKQTPARVSGSRQRR